MSAPQIPLPLAEALRIEGSELRIQMAGPDNLDWTYRVRFFLGDTGREVTRDDEDLQSALVELAGAIAVYQRPELEPVDERTW